MLVHENINKHVSFNRYIIKSIREIKDSFTDPKSADLTIAPIKAFDRTFEKYVE